jgi:glycerol kinase
MSASGRIVKMSYRKHRQIMPDLGGGVLGIEHDPREIWENTCKVVGDVAAGRSIAAVGIANQGETVMVWNRETGEPLYNAIVWQDCRTQPWMDALRTDTSVVRIMHERTGLRPDAYFSASKIRWLLDHVPEAARLLRRGKLCAGTLDAWLIYKLTGGAAFVTDPGTAARTLLYDIHALRYDPDLLELFGVPQQILPEVTEGPFGTVVEPVAASGAPIAASMVDQPAAVYGLGCLRPGDVKATYGTGCFIYTNCGSKAPVNANGMLSTIAWSRRGKPVYALDGGIFAAGSVLEYLVDRLGILANVTRVDSVLKRHPSSGSVVCVPAFAGLAAPYWRRDAKAAFLGLDLGTSPGMLVRAALEGVACRVAQVVRAMEGCCAGNRIRSLKVDGGLTRSAEFLQIQADMLGVPVAVAANPDSTVLGACYMAARNMGIWDSDQKVLQLSKARALVRPRIGAAERKERMAHFNAACDLVASWKS